MAETDRREAPPDRQAADGEAAGHRAGIAGVELDLPARFHLPQGLHRQPSQPVLRDHELGALPPAPGEGEAARGEGELHALPRWSVVLPLHPAHRHRHLPDVLLPADGDERVERHLHAAHRGHLRIARAQHAPMGRAPHGADRLPAHGARLLPRRLQTAARVQLDHRRRAADAHPPALVHRLPAPVGPIGRYGPSPSART